MNKYSRYSLLAVVLLWTFFIYSPSLRHQFTNWDDDHHLLGNLAVRSVDGFHLKEIATQVIQGVYIPLTILSFAIEYHFFHYQPFIYHLDNVLLHLGATAIIFYLALLLGAEMWGAAAAALLFGIHPMHVESVVWVTERKDVLCGFFYLLSVYQYCRYRLDGKPANYVASLICGLLAILAKPMALSLPFILLICDWFLKNEIKPKMILNKLPYFFYIVPIAYLTYIQNMRIPGRAMAEGSLIWVWSFTFYLKKFFLPVFLVPLYQIPHPVSFLNYQYILSITIFLFVLFCLFYFRKNRLFVFAFLVYVGSIFFLLRYDNAVDVSIVADRFMYIPSFGFCIALGVGFERIWNYLKGMNRQSSVFAGVIILLAGVLSLQTLGQVNIWKDSKSLWSYVVLYNPNDSHVYHNLGEASMQERDFAGARRYFLKSIELDPRREESWINLGVIERQQENPQKAIEYFEKARSANPKSVAAYNNLGDIYTTLNQLDKAEAAFNQARENDPMYLEPRYNLTRIYWKQNQYDKAGAMLQEILQLSPRDEFANLKIIEIYLINHKTNAALSMGKIALNESTNEVLLTDLGGVFAENNFANMALALYQKALALNPRNKEIYVEMGKFYGNMENFPKAIELWQKGSRLDPKDLRFAELIAEAERLEKEKK